MFKAVQGLVGAEVLVLIYIYIYMKDLSSILGRSENRNLYGLRGYLLPTSVSAVLSKDSGFVHLKHTIQSQEQLTTLGLDLSPFLIR